MEYLGNHSFWGAFVAGIAVIIVAYLTKQLHRRYVKAPKVFSALVEGLKEHNQTFLHSSYLASKTSFTVSEVEILCTMHSKIDRNQKQLESWCLK